MARRITVTLMAQVVEAEAPMVGTEPTLRRVRMLALAVGAAEAAVRVRALLAVMLLLEGAREGLEAKQEAGVSRELVGRRISMVGMEVMEPILLQAAVEAVRAWVEQCLINRERSRFVAVLSAIMKRGLARMEAADMEVAALRARVTAVLSFSTLVLQMLKRTSLMPTLRTRAVRIFINGV